MSNPLQQITAWSYSRYKDYKDCPFRAYQKHVLRKKELSSSAADRGTAIHKLAEDFTLGKEKKLPTELSQFSEDFKALRKVKALCEASWAFTKSWGQTDWFASTAWLRVKVDAFFKEGKRLTIIDHKTGKPRPSHSEQLSLYALGGMLVYPEVETVTAKLWYLDHGNQSAEDFKMSSKGTLQKTWLSNTRAMMADTKFAPKPGPGCRWCHLAKDKGGPCKFSSGGRG